MQQNNDFEKMQKLAFGKVILNESQNNPYKEGTVQYELINLLSKGPISYGEISKSPSLKEFGIDRYTPMKLSYHLNNLISKGYIEKLAKGIYGIKGTKLDSNQEQSIKKNRAINSLKEKIEYTEKSIDRVQKWLKSQSPNIQELWIEFGKRGYDDSFDETNRILSDFAKQHGYKGDEPFPNPYFGKTNGYNFRIHAVGYVEDLKDLKKWKSQLSKLENM